MSCSAPGLFRSHSDFFSKAGSTTQKMVQTAGGDVHFVEKKVSLGLIDEEPPVKSPGSDELEVTENNSRLQRKSSQKRKANRSKSEGNLALRRVADQVCLTQTLPVLGEPRHVYLDMKWARFGFRLQSYCTQSDKEISEQTVVVQTVTAGSPAFMAGLHAGDCILEVNGENVRCASADEIVSAIMNTKERRVQLLVKYVDGARRLELKKNLQKLQNKLAEKQKHLRDLLSRNHCSTSFPVHKKKLETRPSFNYVFWTPDDSNSACNSARTSIDEDQLSELSLSSMNGVEKVYTNIAVYTNDITLVACDVLIIPFENRYNITVNGSLILKLLKCGGDKLWNELALANYCPLGDVIVTTGGEIDNIGHIYHCILASSFESYIKQACMAALERAMSVGAITVVFWLEGFIDCLIPPTMLIQTIKQAIDENATSFSKFGAIIFAAKSIPGLLELITEIFAY